MKYKKSLLAAACAVGILTLAGCGSSDDSSNSATVATPTVATKGIMASGGVLPLSAVVSWSGYSNVSASITDTTASGTKFEFTNGSGCSGITNGGTCTFDVQNTDATLGVHTLTVTLYNDATPIASNTLDVKALPGHGTGTFLTTKAAQDTFSYSVDDLDTELDSVSFTFDGINWYTQLCPNVGDEVHLGFGVVEQNAVAVACLEDPAGSTVNADGSITTSGATTLYYYLNGNPTSTTSLITSGSYTAVSGDTVNADIAPGSIMVSKLLSGATINSGATLNSGAATTYYAFAANTTQTAGSTGSFSNVGGLYWQPNDASPLNVGASAYLAEGAVAAVRRGDLSGTSGTDSGAGVWYAFSNGTSGAVAVTSTSGLYLDSFSFVGNGAGSTINSEPLAVGNNTVAWVTRSGAALSAQEGLNYAVARDATIVASSSPILISNVASTATSGAVSVDASLNTVAGYFVNSTSTTAADVGFGMFIDSDSTAANQSLLTVTANAGDGYAGTIGSANGLVVIAGNNSGSTSTSNNFAFTDDTAFTNVVTSGAAGDVTFAQGIVAFPTAADSGAAAYYVQGVTSSGDYVANEIPGVNALDSNNYAAAENTIVYRILASNTTNNPNTYGYIYQTSSSDAVNNVISSSAVDSVSVSTDADNMGNLATVAGQLSDPSTGTITTDQGTTLIQAGIISTITQPSIADDLEAGNQYVIEFVSSDNFAIEYEVGVGTGAFAFRLPGNDETVYMPSN